jgi:hypothetical protein
MSSNVINQVAFLRTSREFPEELHQLTVEINKTYLDIANAVNSRVIGIFTINRPAQTGESWFFTTRRQQSFRQVYTFTTTANINIGFKLSSIAQISPRSYGSFTDAAGNWYGIIYASNVAIGGQLSFFLLATADPKTDQIEFEVGGGAPTITSGFIVLEWLSQV